MGVRLHRRSSALGVGLLLAGALVTLPATAEAHSARLVKATQSALHFPVSCRSIITPSEISTILKRKVLTGISSDVDPRTSLCYFDTLAGTSNDLSVSVDAFSSVYTILRKDYPSHKVANLGNVATVTTKQDVEVIGFYGSWYLDVKAYTPFERAGQDFSGVGNRSPCIPEPLRR